MTMTAFAIGAPPFPSIRVPPWMTKAACCAFAQIASNAIKTPHKAIKLRDAVLPITFPFQFLSGRLLHTLMLRAIALALRRCILLAINKPQIKRLKGAFMARVSLQVNGKSQVVDTDPTTPLLYVLR